MSKKDKEQQQAASMSKSVEHKLLLYYNLGRRYRPPAVLLIVMGVFAFLPSMIAELENEFVEPEILMTLGTMLILVGLAFWTFSHIAMQRAYVMCRPDLLVVRAPFYRCLVSYRRIKDIRAIPVRKIFKDHKIKGMGKPLMDPLMDLYAVVVVMKSWPKPKGRLKLFFSPYLFSPRKGEEAWVFIVPNHSILMRQIDEFQLRKFDEDRGDQSYKDPIDRLQHYSG